MLNNAEDVKKCSVNLIQSAADYLKRSLPESPELTQVLNGADKLCEMVNEAVDYAEKAQTVQAEMKSEPSPMPEQTNQTPTTDIDAIMDAVKSDPISFMRYFKEHEPKAWARFQSVVAEVSANQAASAN